MATTLRGFLNDLQQVVIKTKGSQALKLANGSCPNMEQYHHSCGRMQGMDDVVGLAFNMLGQLENDIDDDGLPEMKDVGNKL